MIRDKYMETFVYTLIGNRDTDYFRDHNLLALFTSRTVCGQHLFHFYLAVHMERI